MFRGNVKITMEQGQLTADEAQINFIKKLLAKAVANGKPAEFEQQIAKTGKMAHGHADTIDYDVDQGRGAADQECLAQRRPERDPRRVARSTTCSSRRIVADAAEQGSQRVHIIITPPPVQTMSVLRALNLAKSYKSRQVLKDLSLEVESGEVVGLLGPNGAGKTTAFYMIVGLTRCEHGEIYLDNRDIGRLPMHRRAQLGAGLSAAGALRVPPAVGGGQHHGHPRDPARASTRPQRDARLKELLEELHIGHVRDSLGLSLSGGERRRVEIARALAADPRFILLDEPFAGVDPLSVADIQRIIKHLSDKGIGVLITDHNVRETLGICDRAYIVSQGTVLASGSADQILANPQVREVYLGQDFKL